MPYQSFRERMKTIRIMADAKAKTTTKTPTKPPTREVRDSRLWSLICLAREVGGDVEGIQDYGSLVDEKRRLQQLLTEKSQEVLSLTQELAQVKAASAKEISVLTQTFGEQYKLFVDDKNKTDTLRVEVQRLMTELNTATEKDNSRQERLKTLELTIGSIKSSHDKLQQKNQKMERDCRVHRSQLQAAKAELDEYESNLKQANADLGRDYFRDIDENRELRFREELQSLSTRSFAIAKEFLSNAEIDMNAPLSQSLQALVPNLPLPSGTSKEAILMRRAVGQAVISRALTSHIFRPFYIVEDFSKAADYMMDFFEEKEEQHIYRHQILKLTDDPEMRAVAEVAKRAAHDVSNMLDRLVSIANVENFRHKVEEHLHRAAKIWFHEAQRASDLVEVLSPQNHHDQLDSYLEFGTRTTGKGMIAQRDIAATLFPRISVNEKILHNGIVLWADSPAAMVAKDQIPSPTLGRSGTGRRNGRRNSLAAEPNVN